jgi:predicted membrane protein
MTEREFKRRARRINERTPLGLILLIVGGALLARQLGVIMPAWLFTWEMLLIVIGLTIGFANRFRDIGWLVIAGVGVFFLMDDVYPALKHYFWPGSIILIGLIIMLSTRRKKKFFPADEPQQPQPGEPQPKQYQYTDAEVVNETADVLDVAAVFGAVKRVVLSKNFKGGEIVSVFGGSEINLSQADFQGQIKLEVVAIFGGAKLIVPANWEIRSEAAAVLGGIDDKRDPIASQGSGKVLILEGTAIFGGIEISSY